jgi:hypothetical protein
MNLNAPELMEPVFRFLDGLITDYGLYLYMAMVWASPFLIVWILKGGLRRKSPRRDSGTPAHIIIIHPPARPPPLPPPVIRDDPDSCSGNDEDSFAA